MLFMKAIIFGLAASSVSAFVPGARLSSARIALFDGKINDTIELDSPKVLFHSFISLSSRSHLGVSSKCSFHDTN